jgi:transposase-like protein
MNKNKLSTKLAKVSLEFSNHQTAGRSRTSRYPIALKSKAVSLLEEEGLTLSELSKGIGISKSALSDWRQKLGSDSNPNEKKWARLQVGTNHKHMPVFDICLPRGIRIESVNLSDLTELLPHFVG